MGKCKPCQENKCEQSYDNRSVCEGGDCTCTCQESGIATFWKAVGSISMGAACVAGGVGITILTAGLGAPLGGAIIGAGSSLITTPIAKAATGECISGGELLVDVGIGAAVGALSGGIGAGGSALSQGASGLVKLGVRAGAGAAAGAVGGAVTETARAIQGEEVSLGSYGKSMGIGLACGTIGGASSHLASNVSKGVSSGIAKAATRIAVQTGTATVTDAGMQLYEAGGDFSQIDRKRLLVTVTSQITVATTAECASSVTLKSNRYNDKLNQMLIENELQEGLNKKAENLDGIKTKLEDLKTHKAELRNIQNDNTATPQEKQERIQRYRDDNKLGTSKSIMKKINQRIAKLERQIGPNKPNYEQAAMQKEAATQRLRQANRLPPEVIKEETQKVQQHNKLSSEIQELKNHRSNVENIRADPNPDLTPRDKHQMEQKYLADNKLGNGLKRVNQRIAKLEAKLGNVGPSKIGKDNLHFLTGDRTGQIAMDGPDENGNRGLHRIIADHNTDNNKFVYTDQSETHDYKGMKKPGENQYHDPYKAQFKDLPANQLYQKLGEHDDKKDKEE